MSILWGKWPHCEKYLMLVQFRSNEVINNQMFDYTNEGKYVVKGPSTRRIVDFSDENSWSILPTGQSGNPLCALQ
jgi:hypothetical protein